MRLKASHIKTQFKTDQSFASVCVCVLCIYRLQLTKWYKIRRKGEQSSLQWFILRYFYKIFCQHQHKTSQDKPCHCGGAHGWNLFLRFCSFPICIRWKWWHKYYWFAKYVRHINSSWMRFRIGFGAHFYGNLMWWMRANGRKYLWNSSIDGIDISFFSILKTNTEIYYWNSSIQCT